MERRGRYLAELRERGVRLVFEEEGSHGSQWAAITSIAAKLGCSAETLRHWVRQAERDAGKRPGLTSSERGPRAVHSRPALRLHGGLGEVIASPPSKEALTPGEGARGVHQ